MTGLLGVTNFNVAEYLVMATKQGKIKRTALDAYSNVRSTGMGTPLSRSIDVSASPTPSCPMA